MRVSDVQSLLAVTGHRHRPGEPPVTRAKAVTALSQVRRIQRADAHPDSGGTRRIPTGRHDDTPILAYDQIVGVSKATLVEPIVDNTNGLDVLHRDAWRCGLSAHCSPPSTTNH